MGEEQKRKRKEEEKKMKSASRKISVSLLSLPIRAYRLFISPLLGAPCRFTPSCSEYALSALETQGVLKGLFLIARRLLKCHPWGGSGYDPVPGADKNFNAEQP